MINYIVDIIYLLIAVITIFIFTKRGFIQSLLNHGKFIIAIALSCVFGKKVGALFYNKFFYERIYSWISSKISSVFTSISDKISVDKLTDEIPFIVKQFVTPEKIKEQFGTAVDNAGSTATEIAQYISEPFARLVSNFIAYILVFLLSLVLLFIIGKLFDLITMIPVIHGINKFLGFLLGVFAVFVFLSLLTYVLGLVIGALGNILSLEKLVSTSHLFGFFSKIQLFDLF